MQYHFFDVFGPKESISAATFMIQGQGHSWNEKIHNGCQFPILEPIFQYIFLNIYHRKLLKGTFLMSKDMASSNLTLIVG